MRFAELKEADMSEAQRALYKEICDGPRGRLGAPTSVVFRSVELARYTQKVGEYVRFGTPLHGRIMEFVILIAARYWTAQYAWHAHHRLAIDAGLSPRVATDLAEGRRPSGMKADETAAYDFCTELLYKKEVSDSAFRAAVEHFGESGAIDLMGGLSYYTLQCMALKVNQVPAPGDNPAPLPALG
jgi:4-carboxymuconolactone decarboxylase